jgi:hypothetical protein
MDLEYRSFKELKLRSEVKEGTIGTLEGYAAVFNSESLDFGGWKEVIKPGAFTRSLKELPDVRAFYQHSVGGILGRRSAGTLRLMEDAHGLAVEIDLIDTQLGRDTLANVRAKNLDAMSFGMIPKKHSWDMNETRGYDLRILEDVDLHEVSVVTWPAYEDTTVATRDHKTFKEAQAPEKSTTPFRLLRLRQARLQIQ